MIGERWSTEPTPYGVRGNSIVRHLGESYENIILVGGFSKAYSSLLAFIACPTAIKQVLKTAAPPYLYSGPSPVASLAPVLEGLRVNRERGEAMRATLHRLTARVLARVQELGISPYPLVPREQVGFRLQLTAANTDAQVDHLCTVLGEVADRFQLKSPTPV